MMADLSSERGVGILSGFLFLACDSIVGARFIS